MKRDELTAQISGYTPCNEQEQADKKISSLFFPKMRMLFSGKMNSLI